MKQTYQVGKQLTGLASDGRSLWIADVGSNTVLNFDPATGTLAGSYRVGRGPSHVYFDRQRIWVFSDDGTATIIPLQIPVSISPARTAYDQGMLWMVDPKSQQLEGFSVDSRSVERSFTLPDTPNDVIGSEGTIWLTLRNERRIIGLNPSGGGIVAAIDVGKDVDRMAVDPERHVLWVLAPEDATVAMIDLQSGKVAAEYEMPGKPALVALLDHSAWVATQSPNLLVKLDPQDAGAPPQWELDGLPIGLAADPQTETLWAGISGANVVQQFVLARGQVAKSIEVATEPRVLDRRRRHAVGGRGQSGGARPGRYACRRGGIRGWPRRIQHGAGAR